MALSFFDAACPAGRPMGWARVLIAQVGVALGGRLSDDYEALRADVCEALEDGRLLVVQARAAGAAASPPAEEQPADAVSEEAREDIRIVVVEDGTFRPLAGIEIMLSAGRGGQSAKTTDAEGAVELRGLPPGTCRASAALEEATLETCYEVVGLDVGEPPPPRGAGRERDERGHGQRRFAVALGRHKVATGETLAGVAASHNMTWQRLAKFNFGSSAPDAVNRGLRTLVGCRKKTADRANYVFTSRDAPGIVYVAAPWENSGLRTNRTYTLRVRLPRVPRGRVFLFSM